MVLSLGLAATALGLGLRLRRARAARRPPPPDTRENHLLVAKPAVVLIGLGLMTGPASAVWLRGWEPFGSFHGLVGLATAGLFAAAAFFGRRLERGRSDARAPHAWLAALAMLGAGLTAIAGFVLLP
jgi:hypothetical protein